MTSPCRFSAIATLSLSGLVTPGNVAITSPDSLTVSTLERFDALSFVSDSVMVEFSLNVLRLAVLSNPVRLSVMIRLSTNALIFLRAIVTVSDNWVASLSDRTRFFDSPD